MIPDPLGASLVVAATQRQKEAHRPGSTAGRASVVKQFVEFTGRLRINYKKPTFIHFCWYIEFLAAKNLTPGTISNHVSHLRTYYKLAGLDTSPLHHYRVSLALRAISTNVRHTPKSKDEVTPDLLRSIVAHIPATPITHPSSARVPSPHRRWRSLIPQDTSRAPMSVKHPRDWKLRLSGQKLCRSHQTLRHSWYPRPQIRRSALSQHTRRT